MPQSKLPENVRFFLQNPTPKPSTTPAGAQASAAGLPLPDTKNAGHGAKTVTSGAKKVASSDIKYTTSRQEVIDAEIAASTEAGTIVARIASMADGVREIYSSIKRRPNWLLFSGCGSSNNNEDIMGIEDNLGVTFAQSDAGDMDKLIKMIAYMERFLSNRIAEAKVDYDKDDDNQEYGLYGPDDYIKYLNDKGDRDEIRPRLIAIMLKKIYSDYPETMDYLITQKINVGDRAPEDRSLIKDALILISLNIPALYEKNRAFIDAFTVKSKFGLDND